MKTCPGRCLLARCVGLSERRERVMSREEALGTGQTSAQHVWEGFSSLHSLGCPQPTFQCSTETAFLGFICFEGKTGNKVPAPYRKGYVCEGLRGGIFMSEGMSHCRLSEVVFESCHEPDGIVFPCPVQQVARMRGCRERLQRPELKPSTPLRA